MPDFKPIVAQERIYNLLNDFFGAPVQELEPLPGGQVAQTFSFLVGPQAYILRLNPGQLGASFRKEAFIFQHFASPALPIPTILKVGQLDELVYAISHKAPGTDLTALSPAAYKALLPALSRTLYAIHTCDVSRWSGYGVFDDRGAGMFESWHRSLAAVSDEEDDGFFGKWHALFTTTFLERDFFDTVYSFMLGLSEACPEERYLLHGDFGFGNLLSHQGRITAVLDWLNASYGDFIYDIAWLDFWRRESDFPGYFYRYYARQGLPLAHYTERLACYQAYIGLNAMRFYAQTHNEPAYRFTTHRLREMLAERGAPN